MTFNTDTHSSYPHQTFMTETTIKEIHPKSIVFDAGTQARTETSDTSPRLFTSRSDMPFAQFATQYAALGYAVFPLAVGGKTPITQHGCKDATTNPQRLAAWIAQYPHANIGIHCSGMLRR